MRSLSTAPSASVAELVRRPAPGVRRNTSRRWKTQMGAPEHPHMTKCDMCVDRLRVGLKPACVASCPGRALECGPIEELKKLHPNATFDAVGVPRKLVEQTKPNVLYEARKTFVK